MVAYMKAIWNCRYFWLSLVKMDLRTRYRGSVLGLGWSLAQPLAMTAIFCVVFHSIMHVDLRTFAPLLLIRLSLWGFILNSALLGCFCFKLSEPYIRQYPAPLAIYPIRTVLGLAIHLSIAMLLVVVLHWVLNGVQSFVPLLTLVPHLLLALGLGWSLAVLCGLANVYFPDTRHLAEVIFQALFYLTPVLYPPEMLEGTTLGRIVYLNPLSYFFDLVREPIIKGHIAPLATYAGAVLTVLTLGALCGLLLKWAQKRFIFYL